MTSSFDKPLPHRQVHPIVFSLLILPYGITSGYLNTALAFLFSKAGLSVEQIAGLVALSLLPQIFRFVFAPLIDTLFTVKKWYLFSTILSAAFILAMGLVPVKSASLSLLYVVVLAANITVGFSAMAGSCFAAHDTNNDVKGKASGYLMGGNVGGLAVGGGLGLWLAQRLPSAWIAGAVLAIICLFCCFALVFVKEPVYTVKAKGLAKTFNNLFADVWGIVKSRVGLLILFLAVLPIGTGAAANVFAAIGTEWKATANTIALITGALGGVISMVGCLIGGWMCDRMEKRLAYVIFGLMQGLSAVGMAFCIHTELMFIVWTSLYMLTIGLTYTGAAAFILDAIGKGAATTKFQIYLCLSNAPIYLMTLIAGMAHTHWGSSGLLYAEAVVDLVAAVLFFAFQAILMKQKALAAANI